MAIIVEQIEGVWVRFSGAPNLAAGKVAGLVERGVWTGVDLSAHGLAQALSAEIPDGEMAIGPEEFVEVDGAVRQVFATAPAPDPIEAEREAATMGKAEFLFAVAGLHLISEDEGKAAVNSGAVPSAFASVLDGMDPQIRFLAELKWAGDAEVSRTNPLLVFAAEALYGDQGAVILDGIFGIGEQS